MGYRYGITQVRHRLGILSLGVPLCVVVLVWSSPVDGRTVHPPLPSLAQTSLTEIHRIPPSRPSRLMTDAAPHAGGPRWPSHSYRHAGTRDNMSKSATFGQIISFNHRLSSMVTRLAHHFYFSQSTIREFPVTVDFTSFRARFRSLRSIYCASLQCDPASWGMNPSATSRKMQGHPLLSHGAWLYFSNGLDQAESLESRCGASEHNDTAA